jgi:hypothetical protein
MKARDASRIPPRHRPWPSTCLVAEYTTQSAPSRQGLLEHRRAHGVVDHEVGPARRATAATAAMSMSSVVGFAGLSRKNTRVLGRTAAAQAVDVRPVHEGVLDAELRQQVRR